MKTFIYFFVACLFLCCQAEPQLGTIRPEGIYNGTFQRGSGRIFQVEITFSNGHYAGNILDTLSNGAGPGSAPRICKGKFSVSPGTVYFENECFFTAEFDWTLILSQDWKADSVDNRLILSRNDDRYSLKK